MIEVYTDGATRGNPGPSGIGVYIIKGKNSFRFKFSLPTMTNHEAEFHAVIEALKICQQYFPNEILSFRSDSKIVVDTVDKNYTKNKMFLPLLENINDLSAGFAHFFIKWIPDRENIHADELAKQALNGQD